MNGTAPRRVCMVCSGNICRSPMAEVVLRARLAEAGEGDRFVVDSAGTGDWHAGDHADPRTTDALLAAGYDTAPDAHVARAFARDWFARYDVVVAMDRGHERALRALAATPEERAKVKLLRTFTTGPGAAAPGAARTGDLDVPDPYYGDDSDFADSLRIIEEAMPGLAAWLVETDAGHR
ncbi:low molecular weight protein-tyrosine-phosphatase [Streptomyces avicenniae]|uniref:low molecular weight protein-tyrosine-phosphatase n=1 Tax=Streptomyces avicenniae TaxID=500153 RepID=UPI00069B04B5|nr:low molecular weight protein-tyrosine-phosphatase [Streptomyces avicenniae]